MKKVLNFSLALLAIVILSASCSKKDDPIPEPVVPITAVSVTPAVGAIDVKVDSKISITFSGKPSPALVNGSLALLTVDVAGTKVPVTMSYDGNKTVIFTPTEVLLKGTSYVFKFEGASTADGNQMLIVSIPFKTEGIPFLVTIASPAYDATGVKTDAKIVLTFNKKPSDDIVKGTSFSLVGKDGKNTVCTFAYDGNLVLTCTPKEALFSSEKYMVQISKPVAADGTKMASDFSYSFTVEKIPFKIVSVVPANLATGVSVSAKVVITFSKKLNTAVATGGEFALAGMNVPTSSVVTYDGKYTITMTPTALMAKNTIYSGFVTNLFSEDGDKIAQESFGFTTEK